MGIGTKFVTINRFMFTQYLIFFLIENYFLKIFILLVDILFTSRVSFFLFFFFLL